MSCAERELSSALDNKIGNFKLLINGLVFSMTEIYFQKLIFIPAMSPFMNLTFTRLFSRQSWRHHTLRMLSPLIVSYLTYQYHYILAPETTERTS